MTAPATHDALDFDALLTPETHTAPGKTSPLVWTTGAIALAVALLLVFNAVSPQAWTATLDPNPLSLASKSAADAWWRQTDRLGLAQPRAQLHALWTRIDAMTWTPLGTAPTRASSSAQR